MLKINIKVTKNLEGKRLDKVLKDLYKEYTRKEIKLAIKQGKIKVNYKIVKPSYKITLCDIIKGELKKISDVLLKPNKSIELKIIFEDKNIIAINKTPGIVVVPDKFHKANSIANALIYKFPYLKDEFFGSTRAGILHRLDKETSGVLIVAKTKEVFRDIQKLFLKRKIKKIYLGFCFGNIKEKKGKIRSYLKRSYKDPRKRIVVSKIESFFNGAKLAITYYEVLKNFKNFCYVKIFPKTGRMHQIRAQFLEISHPILGDKLYRKENDTSQAKLEKFLEIKRLMLHCYCLEFFYKNKYYKIEAPLPEDFKKILKTN